MLSSVGDKVAFKAAKEGEETVTEFFLGVAAAISLPAFRSGGVLRRDLCGSGCLSTLLDLDKILFHLRLEAIYPNFRRTK